MYALTRLAARARIRQQQQEHLQAIDICSKHAERWDTPDHPAICVHQNSKLKFQKLNLIKLFKLYIKIKLM